MQSYNRVFIMGRLGKSPQLQSTRNGDSFCRLNIATDSYRAPGTERHTTWHMVHVFGKSAENCVKYLNQGSMVFVEGTMDSSFIDENEKRSWKHWIHASRVTFMSRRNSQEETVSEESLGEVA